ncbi:MAG: hypothetical protein A2277_17795 [Desulfobacterales bacterium RIFOXYA12_FULL_46_15]|nr:MAG: hypothetical protein A2277_17795 [Desulfobacterales bacterium RIFOXYA12_FULL_46_15]
MHIKNNSYINPLFFLIVFLFGSFIYPEPARAVPDKSDGSGTYSQKIIDDYQHRVISTEGEIRELKENLAWLDLKIKGIIYSNRPVPQSIYNSVQHKTERLNALEKERAYCINRLSGFLKPEEPAITQSQISGQDTDDHDFVKKLQSRIENAHLSDWIAIEHDKDGRSYRLKTILPILFSSGSALLFKEYDDFLRNFALVIKDLDAQIVVDGYADINPIHTKQYPSNFELGATRAANVVHSLVRHGVKPSIFKIASTGKYRFFPLKMSANKTLERYVNITVFISG